MEKVGDNKGSLTSRSSLVKPCFLWPCHEVPMVDTVTSGVQIIIHYRECERKHFFEKTPEIPSFSMILRSLRFIVFLK